MQAWEHKRENPEYGISDSDGADVHQTKINMVREQENELLKYKTAKVVNEKGEYPEINSLPGRKLVDGVFMVFYNNMWMTVDKYKKQRENHSRPSPLVDWMKYDRPMVMMHDLYSGLPKTTSGKKDAQTLVSNLGTRPARASKPFSVQVHVPVTRDIYMDKIISRKEGGRKTRRKKKHRRKTKRKRKKRKRRTRKKRGRGIGLSRPAKVAAIGALTLGSGVATVSPTAKQTYQEIMRAPCNAPFRQMVLPHHPDKGGNIDDFSFVESARQSRKGSCKRNKQTPSAKPKPPSGQSRKKWKQQQRTQRRQAKEEARKQSERQEEADRKTGQQKPSDTTDYGDMARKIGATAAVLGGLEYVRRRPGYGPNNPRPRRSLTPPRR